MVDEKEVLQEHDQHGVLEVSSTLTINDREELSLAYTPGVAVLARRIAAHPEDQRVYTVSGKLIAVVTDGSAVLGLGNIGPGAGLPVVEGKSLLYQQLAGVNAIPLAMEQTDVDKLADTLEEIAPSFAGIHLEDIAAPACFALEDRLKQHLSIPVYHDDQEGTAIVTLAGLINAAKVVGKDLADLRVVINGVGASGVATGRLLLAAGIKQLILVDKDGVVKADDDRFNEYQRALACESSLKPEATDLRDAITAADVFIGLSVGNVLSADDVKKMAAKPIIFALANPEAEIKPETAKEAGAAVVATGSSQYPNQINNILVFPGLFKGLLESGIKQVTPELEIAVARALAGMVKQANADLIIPEVLNEQVVPTVCQTVLDYAAKLK